MIYLLVIRTELQDLVQMLVVANRHDEVDRRVLQQADLAVEVRPDSLRTFKARSKWHSRQDSRHLMVVPENDVIAWLYAQRSDHWSWQQLPDLELN